MQKLFSFQFNSGTYPIWQLLSLKLPMDSKRIQASSSKSISILNNRRDFHIYFATLSATLPQKCQNDVLCGNVKMDVSTYIIEI